MLSFGSRQVKEQVGKLETLGRFLSRGVIKGDVGGKTTASSPTVSLFSKLSTFTPLAIFTIQ